MTLSIRDSALTLYKNITEVSAPYCNENTLRCGGVIAAVTAIVLLNNYFSSSPRPDDVPYQGPHRPQTRHVVTRSSSDHPINSQAGGDTGYTANSSSDNDDVNQSSGGSKSDHGSFTGHQPPPLAKDSRTQPTKQKTSKDRRHRTDPQPSRVAPSVNAGGDSAGQEELRETSGSAHVQKTTVSLVSNASYTGVSTIVPLNETNDGQLYSRYERRTGDSKP